MPTPATFPIKVLMVCLGNICRSPTAEGVLRRLVHDRELQQYIEVDSAGTSGWHDGEGPDPRTVLAAHKRGYDLAALRSRKVTPADFVEHDYIVAMDVQNLRDLEALCSPAQRSKLRTLLQFGSTGLSNVPDPYERNAGAFEEVLDLCEQACGAFLQYLIEAHGLPVRDSKP